MKFFLFFLGPILAFAKPTICLNMIVKDESPVIRRCLKSVKDIIDYWVIVDTGSTDGTQQIIQDYLHGIPGELHEKPWVNFGHNRNEALKLAKNKGDYLLFIDADEQMIFSNNFSKENITKDYYTLSATVLDANQTPLQFQRVFLINNHLNWKWQGVIHEMLVIPPESKSWEKCQEVTLLATTEDGNRAQDPQKNEKDIQILEKAIAEDPTNSRYVFYLALTYEAMKNYPMAIKNFDKRSKMGGWDQEIFWSLYSSAKYKEMLNIPGFLEQYVQAFETRPSRAEPLYRIAHYYAEINPVLGYIIAKEALSIPPSNDLIPVEGWIYEYGLLLEFAKCAQEIGQYSEAKETYEKFLANQNIPKEIEELARNQLGSVPKR